MGNGGWCAGTPTWLRRIRVRMRVRSSDWANMGPLSSGGVAVGQLRSPVVGNLSVRQQKGSVAVRRRSAGREAVRLGSGVQDLYLEPALDNRPGLADQLVGALVREACATVGRDVGSGACAA